jgi:hypothetical protein
MNNKILKLIVVLVIVVMAVFNWGLVSKSSGISDVSMANIEALALTEDLPEVLIECGASSGACWVAYGSNGNPWSGCQWTGNMSDFCVYG